MTEDDFWSKLRLELPSGHYVRVENLVHPGTPDVSFCVGGVEGWMENKYTDKFPLEHPVLQSQIIWIGQRVRAGGRVIIAVGHERRVFFVSPEFIDEINDWALSDFETCAITAVRGVSSSIAASFEFVLNKA